MTALRAGIHIERGTVIEYNLYICMVVREGVVSNLVGATDRRGVMQISAGGGGGGGEEKKEGENFCI